MALSNLAAFGKNSKFKRRKSQDGSDISKNKKTLDFNDLFDLKQNLISTKAKVNKDGEMKKNENSVDIK
jgi:hypothetical protein